MSGVYCLSVNDLFQSTPVKMREKRRKRHEKHCSIHAPVKSATVKAQKDCMAIMLFQYMLQKSATNLLINTPDCKWFQSTPVKSATYYRKTRDDELLLNPRFKERDEAVLWRLTTAIIVSIHARKDDDTTICGTRRITH